MADFDNNLRRDGSNAPIQAANSFATSDASTSPKASPLAIDTNIVTIARPEDAAEMVVTCDVAIRVSDLSDVSTYFTVPAATVMAIGIARMTSIYIRTGSGSGTLQFYFVKI